MALPGAAFVFGSDYVRNSISTPKARLLLVLGAAQLGAIVLFEMSPTSLRGWTERLVTVLVVASLGLLQVLSRTNAQTGQPRTVVHGSFGWTFGGEPLCSFNPTSSIESQPILNGKVVAVGGFESGGGHRQVLLHSAEVVFAMREGLCGSSP